MANLKIRADIFQAIRCLFEDSTIEVIDDMPLIGSDSVLDSMKLVELCLVLEDMAATMNFEFDWTSEVAMSRSRSMFRTAGSLVDEFICQMESKQ